MKLIPFTQHLKFILTPAIAATLLILNGGCGRPISNKLNIANSTEQPQAAEKIVDIRVTLTPMLREITVRNVSDNALTVRKIQINGKYVPDHLTNIFANRGIGSRFEPTKLEPGEAVQVWVDPAWPIPVKIEAITSAGTFAKRPDYRPL